MNSITREKNNTQAASSGLDYTEIGIEATYCVEDNKLRLYCDDRLNDELYQRVNAADFVGRPSSNCLSHQVSRRLA